MFLTSQSKPPGVSECVQAILERQKALSRMPEAPQSPPRWTIATDEESHEERIRALRERVQDAWVKADGNPADGSWAFLAHLLRLSTTSGRNGRWIGARTDVKPADQLPGLGWINAKTESEWAEWEKKYYEERRLKDKVESWKRRVEADGIGNSVGIPDLSQTPAIVPEKASEQPVDAGPVESTPRANVKILTMPPPATRRKATPSGPVVDPLKDSAPFGFSVVKRPATQKTITGKPNGSGNSQSSTGKSVVGQKDTAGPSRKLHKPDILPASTRNTNIKHISEVPEMSFLPPSFQSAVIMTSTPKAAAKPLSIARKPDPIAVKPASSFSSSERGPVTPAASLPVIPSPSTPTRNTTTNQPVLPTNAAETNANNKRVLPASPVTPNAEGRALKKARTMPTFVFKTPQRSYSNTPNPEAIRRALELQSGRQPVLAARPVTPTTLAAAPVLAAPPVASTSSPLSPAPATPKSHGLPKLTDLLASSKKAKASAATRKASAKASTKGKDRQRQKPLEAPVHAQKKNITLQVGDDTTFAALPSFPSFPARPIDPYADDANFLNDDIITDDPNAYVFDPYADNADVDASPTKSLSSLAGSDSEDEIEDADDARPAHGLNVNLSSGFQFKPPITSTQQPRGPFVAGASNNPADSQRSRDSWASVYAPGSGSNRKADAASSGGGAPKSSNPFLSYNSQFESDVAAQVDRVSKLLDRDVDYGGWLRDPSEEPAAGVEESP